METASFWGTLKEAASRAGEGRLGLWAWLKEKVDLAQYRPQAAPGVEAHKLTGRDGEYYILKNPGPKTYHRLSPRDHFLWQLMDGTQTVKDLVVAYFLEYGSFAFARVATLVGSLRADLFLTEQPVYVYRQVRSQILARSLSFRIARFWEAFVQTQFTISGLDRWITALYRWGGRVLFFWPLHILFIIVSAVGLYAFAQAINAETYGMLRVGDSYWLGIVVLIAANVVGLLLHELSHALTVKHFGREVRRGGFLINLGMPAVFVDTMDMWLESKRARLAVTWAGPYSGLVIGGLVSIFLMLRPEFGLNAVLYQFTLVTYLTVFLNLNPLLEWDGYYLLMDWLEIPMLRQRSLDFVQRGLVQKLRGIREAGQSVRSVLGSMSREQRIFSVFGLLSAAWTGYALFMAARFWQSQLIHALRGLWGEGGNIGKVILAVALIAISLQFMLSIALYVLGAVRRALVWADRRGYFDNTWHVAGMLLALAVALTLAPNYVRHPAVRPVLNLATLGFGAYFAWRGAAHYAGSRFAPVFRLLALFLVGLFLSEAGAQAVYWDVLSSDVASPFVIATRHLAYACLVLAGVRLFVGTNLRDLRAAEMALLALGILASGALAVWMVTTEPTTLSSAGALLDLTGSVFPLLALTLLAPTLLSFLRTAFGPAWLALSLALAGLVAVVLQGWYPLFSYLLLAAGFSLHHLARTRVSFVSGQPEAALDLSDRRRLQRAFAWTVASVFGQFREVGGERHARILAERFNSFALAAAWRVSIVADQVEDSIPAEVTLIERGETYAAALTLLLDLIAQEVGEKLTVQALQGAYDALPWEEREIGAQYLFPDVDRAETLSREFQATRQDYRGLLRRMPVFATMEDEEINLLVSRLVVEQASPGQVVIRQGDRGDKFYIIAQGHVEVSVRDKEGASEVVNQLDRGDYFGELALLHDAPRNATCRATVPTKLLSLSREDFLRLVKARFALREKVDRSIKWADLLRQMPLFAELDAQQVQLIAAQLREEAFEPGEVIIRQGEIGETFYVIESGRVQVSVSQDGEERAIAERGAGEYVGEIALLLEVPRTATVRALTPTNVLTLHKSDFDRLVVKHLYVSRGLERETSRRMIDLQRVAEAS